MSRIYAKASAEGVCAELLGEKRSVRVGCVCTTSMRRSAQRTGNMEGRWCPEPVWRTYILQTREPIPYEQKLYMRRRRIRQVGSFS